ncbi:MAG: PAS domain S-box protein [Rhodoferax sp.]
MNFSVLQKCSLKVKITLFTLLIFMVSIWTLAFYLSQMLREDMQRVLGEQQFSVVSLVAADIDRDLSDRLQALEKVAALITPALLADSSALQGMLENHIILGTLFNGGVTGLAIDGTAVADAPRSNGRIGINFSNIDYVAANLRQGLAMVGKPIIGPVLKAPVFGMGVPIRDAQGQVIGALSGVTSLGSPNFLDRIAQNTYGKTGGYLLVAPQYRLVVTATDKRRIMEQLPAAGVSPLLDRLIQGYQGSQVFVNPLGVEVLVSTRQIATAGWYLAALLPTDEAFAPIRAMQQRMLLATIVLTLLAGCVIWWMLRRQLAPLLGAVTTLASQSQTNQPLQALHIAYPDEIGTLIGSFNRLLHTLGQREAALQSSEARYRSILSASPDDITITDLEGRIQMISPAGLTMLGCQSDHDIVGHLMTDFLAPEEHARAASNIALMLQGILTGPAEYRGLRLDASSFYMEVNADFIRNASAEPTHLVFVARDITRRRRAEEALAASEMRFRKLLQDVPSVAVQGYLADGTTCYWNLASEQLYGYSQAEALGRNLLELIIPPEMHTGVQQAMRTMFATGEPIPAGELALMRKDGSLVSVFSSHVHVHIPGQAPEMFCLDIDLTERKQAEDMLRLAAGVFVHSREGIMITRPDGAIIDVNQAFTRITGYARDEVLGKNPRLLNSGHHDAQYFADMWRELIGQGYWSGEIWNRRKNGEVFIEMQTISAVCDAAGVVQHYVTLFTDITALKEHEHQLHRMAHFDALTGLPNRLLLADRMQQGLAQADRRSLTLAVVYLDLDGFKAVNDRYGHEVGDQLLIALGQRMKLALREGDTLARIGGDEFVAVLVDLPEVADTLLLLNRLLEAAAAPVPVGELSLQVSASLGVTCYPQAQEMNADTLLRQADQAMYQAKTTGKNCYHFFGAP